MLPVRFLFSISLLLLFFLHPQVRTPVFAQVATGDTIDFKKELTSLPGNTIGQKMESLLFWSVAEKERRFPHMQNIFPSIAAPAGSSAFRLKKGKEIHPRWDDGTTISSYIKDNNIGGVIVLKDDRIRLEAYGDGVTENTVWTSFSVAKSVTSMLLGVALKEGDVHSLEDSLGKYISELRGRDYGKVTIRQLLTMTSGVSWNEDYADPQSDVAQMYQLPCEESEAHILTYMKGLKLEHQPGKVWNYSTGETDLLGILIQKATGKSLAAYLSEKIWKPWGMEHKAYWIADECSNLNLGGSGLSSTLRDYARLGTVMLHQGKRGKKKLLSDEWLEDATSLLYPTGKDGGGYGYLWWRYPDGSYSAVGIFGQMIYVNPKKNLVIAQFAAWPHASSKALSEKRMDFVRAVERAL